MFRTRLVIFAFLLCALIVGCSGGSSGGTGSAQPSSNAPPSGNPPLSGNPPPPGQIPAERAVLNVAAATAWTSCGPEFFGGCTFEGLREIRYGTDGKWRTKTYLNSFPGWECNSGNFGGDPAPGAAKRCEVSNVMLTGTISAPRVCHAGGLCPAIDLAAIPIGLDGAAEMRVRPTTEVAPDSSDGTGNFRTVCGFSHMAFDDPIVYPGQPGVSHLHAFFGNAAANAYSTAQSLANSGKSTCLVSTAI